MAQIDSYVRILSRKEGSVQVVRLLLMCCMVMGMTFFTLIMPFNQQRQACCIVPDEYTSTLQYTPDVDDITEAQVCAMQVGIYFSSLCIVAILASVSTSKMLPLHFQIRHMLPHIPTYLQNNIQGNRISPCPNMCHIENVLFSPWPQLVD